ncbi:hypothetical protein EW026_g2340 [Hermanssonia centrifuga]|uniref:Ornithine decarboxylase antizyme n=1 Tax=Hermanssonia centrifuga TaxID=98765 RepID=A0A4S4KPB3_9APHY|nr:hypothetical protein EW026_g2340 [Hermanssonia centrifuga]
MFYSNGRQTVGDGAFSADMTPSVLAVCHMQGTDSMYYYSTAFSGGPGLPGKAKTLYVDGKSAADVNLRESIVALLDLADERLECTALVLALEKSSPVLGELLHSLMYVGGTVVTAPPFPVDSAYVLVGMEI